MRVYGVVPRFLGCELSGVRASSPTESPFMSIVACSASFPEGVSTQNSGFSSVLFLKPSIVTSTERVFPIVDYVCDSTTRRPISAFSSTTEICVQRDSDEKYLPSLRARAQN